MRAGKVTSFVSLAGVGYDGWVKTVHGNLWRSSYTYCVAISNAIATIGILNAWRVRTKLGGNDLILIILLLLAWVVLYADLLIYKLYEKTRESTLSGALSGDALDAVLASTFIAYRMSLVGIAAIGCCLQLTAFLAR